MFINPCSRLKIDSAAYTGVQEKYMKYGIVIVNVLFLIDKWLEAFFSYTSLMVRWYPKPIA
jgi:hypothetical protein